MEKKIFAETGGQPDLEGQDYIVGRLLKPEARKDIVEFFAEQEIVPTSMIDISDGLSSEILHICKQSSLGCVLYEDKIPVYEDARQFAYKLELDPTACALSGGEDYELLFTIRQSDFEKLKNHPDIHFIGHIHDNPAQNVMVSKQGTVVPIKAQGWNHFR